MHRPRVFVVGLAGVIRFNRFELRDVFEADKTGLVTEAAGRLQELPLVAASGFGQDKEALQAGFLSEAPSSLLGSA